MSAFQCFTRQQLQDYLVGKTPDELGEQIANHLNDCEICEDTVVGLDAKEDTLIAILAHPVDDDESESSVSPAYQLAVERVKNLDFTTANAFQTQPERIGEYEIIDRIGTGGMGSVFRAQHLRLEKPVAIKILPPRKMQNTESIKRFTREMKIIGQMDHRSMVSATDAGEDDGTHFLVMELVDGMDLARVVRQSGPFPPESACAIGAEVASGLQYAHAQGVVHRDIKPSNLMLSRNGSIKILDLGLATLGGLHGAVDELTTVGQLMGTLDYMAPEQCGNNHEVDQRTDIYGLGATLYKLLTGHAPYSSPSNDSPLKKLKAMATSPPVPLRERRADLDEGLCSIVETCLARNPEDRFESAEQVIEQLQRFADSTGLQALLERAEANEQLAGQPNNGMATTDFPTVLKQTNQPAKPDHAKQPTTKPSRDRNRFSIATMIGWMATAIACGLGGILIYLNLLTGQLVIESELDNVTVTLVKDEAPVQQLEVEHGPQSTRLRVGQYRIKIDGPSDELVVENETFQLKRGETVVARISMRPKKSGENSSIPSRVGGQPNTANPLAARLPKTTPDNSQATLGLMKIEVESQLKIAKIKADAAKKKYDLDSARHGRGSMSLGESEASKRDYLIAKQELENLEKKLEYLRKYQPTPTAQAGLDLPLEILDAEREVRVAEINLQSKSEQLKHTTRLYEKGFVTGNQKTKDEMELELAESDLKTRKTQS